MVICKRSILSTLLKSVIVSIAVVLAAGSFLGCSDPVSEFDMPDKSDELKDGVYFMTESSWRSYSDNRAQYEHVEIKPRSSLYVAVLDSKMTVSENYIVYDISPDNGVYLGKTLNYSVTVWLIGDTLYVRNGSETLQYAYDNSYTVSEFSADLDAPDNIRYGVDKSSVTIDWDYRHEYGVFGACAEISMTDNGNYVPIKIDRVYMNEIVLQIFRSDLELGENRLRIYHIGGPMLNVNKNEVYIANSSSYIYLVVTMTEDKISVDKISTLEVNYED